MKIWPAIDIIDQKPVRLYQGDYNQKEIVGQSVLEIAKQFEQSGASCLHLVDLDGAKEGSSKNEAIIIEVANKVNMKVEVGGGIRTKEQIERYLSNGLDRVILGTVAIEQPEFLKEMVDLYGGEKIVVGMDVKGDYVMTRGWLEDSKVTYQEMVKSLEKIGVKTIIVTDISKDGTLQGASHDLYRKLKDLTSIEVVASGGIVNIQDIEILSDIKVAGAITGKALYHGSLDLKEALSYEGD